MYTDNAYKSYRDYHKYETERLGFPTNQQYCVVGASGRKVLSSAYYSECKDLIENMADCGWTDKPYSTQVDL